MHIGIFQTCIRNPPPTAISWLQQIKPFVLQQFCRRFSRLGIDCKHASKEIDEHRDFSIGHIARFQERFCCAVYQMFKACGFQVPNSTKIP